MRHVSSNTLLRKPERSTHGSVSPPAEQLRDGGTKLLKVRRPPLKELQSVDRLRYLIDSRASWVEPSVGDSHNDSPELPVDNGKM